MSTDSSMIKDTSKTELLTSFFIDGAMYGIEVMKVQEVTGQPIIVPVPLAPPFVLGLINLRGQLATSIGLKELLGLGQKNKTEEQMSVVCRVDGNLVSLMVDTIGDVLEVKGSDFETPPDNMPPSVRKFVKGVYKMNGSLLSLLDLDKLSKELSQSTDVKDIQLQQSGS